MKINHDQLDEIGKLADSIENIIFSMTMPLDDELHLTAIREILPEWRDKIKAFYKEVSGENPWNE